ncbi:MAG TPA: nicotinate (nicotinamide) nucleotide adenylyltransferase [Sulfuricurvum sp.]|nr:nicotinate (nicotinamide) nucleotide adenylyltransferase [Sulfuricurvum sp.]
MKLALYGGSFDPPHIGHVHVALKALESLDIDRLIIVPAFRNPFKSSIVAEGMQRIQWLKRIFAPYSNIEISDFEINLNRSVRTIETVLHYAPACEKLYLIIGADNLETLNQWYEYEKLCRLVTFVVAQRDEIPVPPEMLRLDVNETMSSTHFRQQFTPLGLDSEIENDIITYYKEHNESKN